MEDTATEIEIEAHVSIDMENNSNTNQKIEKEEDDDDDDLILKDYPLCTSIKDMLETLSPQSSECCIYRIPWRLRKVNEEAYTPRSISIGPFHHGDERFQNTEEYKLRYLKAFLVRTGRSFAYYLKTVQMWEQRARDYYSETFHLSSDEFVKMILVDGSFIVEFLLRVNARDHIFDKPWTVGNMVYDMILLENQLPLFVLDGFFNSVVPKDKPPLLELFHACCCGMYRLQQWVSLPAHPLIIDDINQLPDRISTRDNKHLVDYIHHVYVSSTPEPLHDRGEYERPPTVTQLHQAGIKFKKRTSISLFDIKFSSNGILEIPQLNIHDMTGSWFQNLIAFEQCHRVQRRIFSEYFVLLDGMIDTSKDVDLLIDSEIITNMLSSSEEVSTLFNNILKEVLIYADDFYFSNLCQELNAYCKSPRHKWIATLRRDYFSTPWAVISVIAAVVLIVLTFIQSICSIISL